MYVSKTNGSTFNNGMTSISFAATSYASGYEITLDNQQNTTLSFSSTSFDATIYIDYGLNDQGGSGDYGNTDWEWALMAYDCVVPDETGNLYGLSNYSGTNYVFESSKNAAIQLADNVYIIINSISIDTGDIDAEGTGFITVYDGDPMWGGKQIAQTTKPAYHYEKIFGTSSSTSSPEPGPDPT